MGNDYNLSPKLFAIIEQLPDCCDTYLTHSETALSLSTRLEYARDLLAFFNYLISYNPHFAIMQLKDITIRDLEKISPNDITIFVNHYTKNENTAARKRASLSAFFKFLCANRSLTYNPVDGSMRVKIHENERVIYLDDEEMKFFLDAVRNGTGLTDSQLKYHERYKTRDLAMMGLFLSTGIRVSELKNIDIQDVELESCRMYVIRKGGKTNMVAFNDSVKSLIEDYLEERREKFRYLEVTDPLFATLKGERLTSRAIEKLVKKYAIAALSNRGNKAYKISPHKLRSSFAMNFYRASNNNILLTKDVMGHESIVTTNKYAKATKQEVYDARNLVNPLKDDNKKNET